MAFMEFSCAVVQQKNEHLSVQNVFEKLKQLSKTNLASVSDSEIDKRERFQRIPIDLVTTECYSTARRNRAFPRSRSSSETASLRISEDEFCREIAKIQGDNGEVVKYFAKGEPQDTQRDALLHRKQSSNKHKFKRRSSASTSTLNDQQLPDENYFTADPADEYFTNKKVEKSSPVLSNGRYEELQLPKSSSASSLPMPSSRKKSMRKRSFVSLNSSVSAVWKPSSKKNSLARREHRFSTIADSMKNPEKQNKNFHRKKKRSSSWYTAFLSPSYKQKNDTFRKCFKQLPETERLLVDCSCALIKDILVQGRIYISQNYVCFHSNILSWQTALMIKLKDIEQVTKERTVKVFPNAIQFQIKEKAKHLTFTSFTHRDKTFKQICKLWQNALTDKPMPPKELWSNVHNNYGADLGCSSEEDYVKPEDGIATTSKVKRKKKQKHTSGGVHSLSISDVSQQEGAKETNVNQYSEDSKSSNLETEVLCSGDQDKEVIGLGKEEDDEPCDHVKEALRREYLVREYPVSAEVMFQILFDDDSDFMRSYLQGKGSTNVVIEKWRDGSDDYEENKIRNLSFKLPLTNPLVPKSSHFEELQILYKESERGRCYAVDGIARSFGVPYSDYFSSIMRYTIRKLTRATCELKVTAQVKYHKTPWGLVKNFIDKNVHGGTEENFQLLERQLQSYLSHSRIPHSRLVPKLNQSNSLPKAELTTIPVAATTDSTSKTTSQDIASGDHKVNVTSAPSSTHLGFSGLSNNTNYEKQYQHKVEITNGKWFFRILCMVFILLLWSNYAMYRRITTLEQTHSHYLKDEVSIDSYNGYDIPDGYSDASSKALQMLDHRLSIVETLVRNFTITSDRRWSAISNEWKSLQKTMIKLVSLIDDDK